MTSVVLRRAESCLLCSVYSRNYSQFCANCDDVICDKCQPLAVANGMKLVAAPCCGGEVCEECVERKQCSGCKKIGCSFCVPFSCEKCSFRNRGEESLCDACVNPCANCHTPNTCAQHASKEFNGQKPLCNDCHAMLVDDDKAARKRIAKLAKRAHK